MLRLINRKLGLVKTYLIEWIWTGEKEMSVSHTAMSEPESGIARDIREGADISTQGADIFTGKWPIRKTMLFVVGASTILWSAIYLTVSWLA